MDSEEHSKGNPHPIPSGILLFYEAMIDSQQMVATII